MKRILSSLAMLLLIPSLPLAFMAVSQAASGRNSVEANKKVVRDFYDLAFNQHKPTEAAKKYIGLRYRQHNSRGLEGAEAFYSYFEGHFKKNPQSRADINLVIGEGDLIVIHANSKLNERDPGRAVVDIFRVENGKIVEHWDVAKEMF